MYVHVKQGALLFCVLRKNIFRNNERIGKIPPGSPVFVIERNLNIDADDKVDVLTEFGVCKVYPHGLVTEIPSVKIEYNISIV